jgi:hypothetical protein
LATDAVIDEARAERDAFAIERERKDQFRFGIDHAEPRGHDADDFLRARIHHDHATDDGVVDRIHRRQARFASRRPIPLRAGTGAA